MSVPMAFERAQQLQEEYTDKYVVVDDSRPELARFRGFVGQVKTINMNGRALVQFDRWENIGWYDIELSFLRVVDKPPPKKEAAHAEKAAKPRPEAASAGKPKPAPKASGGGGSTADILAAARGKAGGGDAPKPAAGGKGASTADILAAA